MIAIPTAPPDPITVLAAILRDTFPGVTVVTVIPSAITGPTVHLSPIGSRMRAASGRGGPLTETATVAVSVWHGPDHADARRLARDVLAALLSLRSVPVPGGVLVAVEHLSGPVHVPDPYARDPVHHYAVSIAATVH